MAAERCVRCLPLLAALTLVLTVPGAADEAEVLLPGPAREGPIAAGEKHVYRVEVGEEPLLVTVEQQDVDLVVEVRGPADQRSGEEAGNRQWGPEVVLLAGAGEREIEVRPKERSWPGRYSIRVQSLAEASNGSDARRQALATMSRAGQEAFGGTQEGRQRAAASYREAAAAWKALGDRSWEAEALTCLAGLETDLARPAAEDYERALALWRELEQPRREAATVNDLGLERQRTGEIAGARQAYESALSLWQRLGDRFDEAETRTNLCYLEQTVGDPRVALTCYEKPRAVFREGGDQKDEDRILNNLGGIYDLLGEPDAALENYQKSLALRRDLEDHVGEAQTLNNIARIHRVVGEWQEALRLYGEERKILQRFSDRSLEAVLLNNLGFTYNSLGEPDRARALLEEALALARENGGQPVEIFILNNLGDVWGRLGDPKKALDHYRQALDLATHQGDARQEAFTRLRLGEMQIEQGDPTAALHELDPALDYLRQKKLHQKELQALLLRGRALILARRPREALPVLQEVVARSRTLRDRAGEAEALHAVATAERALGLLDEARGHAEQAVARVEELRAGFVSPDLRASFLATQRRAYSLLIDLLMDRDAAAAAFAVSERARARSLLDALSSAGAGRGGTVIPAELLDQRQSLRRRLSAKVDQQLKQGRTQAEALGGEIEGLRADLDSVDAEIHHHDPQYAAFLQPQPITLEELSRLLDPETLLLEYALGEERSFLWMAGASGGLRSYILPPQREIEALARSAYGDLSTVEVGAAHRGEAAEALSRILLGPVWKEVAGAGRLVIVPDGALHFLPFAALPVPGPSREPLLEHAEVDYLPSATTLALQRQRLGGRDPAPKLAAVLADPVFAADDSRLKAPSVAGGKTVDKDPLRGAPGGFLPVFEPLPASRREAQKIASLVPAGQVWTATGLDASREAVLSGELRSYRVVHFATHALADTSNPELSGLVLSLVDAAGQPREGFLGLRDIYELDLAADLVVLSGCRTALGKEVRGEGLMGLTRGFLYAGVPRVVASLWPVQDSTGTELMTRFYRAMWRDRLPPAAALRQAQLSLRHDHDPRHRGPFSWAAFVLQGDWR